MFFPSVPLLLLQYQNAKPYLRFDGASDSLAGMFFTQFLYNALLLNSFIPISLYVSMNFVRFLQAWFMNQASFHAALCKLWGYSLFFCLGWAVESRARKVYAAFRPLV